jgi:hypothetical protein
MHNKYYCILHKTLLDPKRMEHKKCLTKRNVGRGKKGAKTTDKCKHLIVMENGKSKNDNK